MHHLTIDSWSNRSSFLHRRDPRAKLICLLLLLAAVSISRRDTLLVCVFFFVLLCILTYTSRLPALRVMQRSLLVLPFCALFAAASFLSGDKETAWRLILRSYVSGFAALLFVATTPLPILINGLRELRAPRFLLLVLQFLYRYLFVLSEESLTIRTAAVSRGGFQGKAGFSAAATALGSLFARAHSRADRIHCAMLSRGFQGELPIYSNPSLGLPDLLLVTACLIFTGLLFAGSFLWT